MPTSPLQTYLRPTSLSQALQDKARLGDGAMFIAGGTDVMVQRRAGLIAPGGLISLRRVPELTGIEERQGSLLMGAGVTLADVLANEVIGRKLPILTEAVEQMGCTQMRNVATVGGNVMSALSSGDTIGPLMCLEARCLLASVDGRRSVPMVDFFSQARQTVAKDSEILTGLDIPLPPKATGMAYLKLGRRAALELAVVSIGALVTLDQDGAMANVRLAAGAVGPTPLRLPGAEAVLTGKTPGQAQWGAAVEAALSETSPWDDVRASRWYRREMIMVMLPRAVRRALNRI